MPRKNVEMTAGDRFKQARNSQPQRVTLQQIADRLGVSTSTVRFFEAGRNDELLAKAIKIFAPEWNLPIAWFYEPSAAVAPPSALPSVHEKRMPYNFGDMIDLPIFAGSLLGSPALCKWDLSDASYSRPIRAGFLSAPPDEYFQLVVAGDAYAPRIQHGGILLVRRQPIVPVGTLTLAQKADSPKALIGIFDSVNDPDYRPFPLITMEDTVIGQIELIHHPTIAGPNLEFDSGRPLLIRKSRAMFQSQN